MYICIARLRKNTSSSLSTGGFSVSVETALVQQLDCADCLLGSEFQTVGSGHGTLLTDTTAAKIIRTLPYSRPEL